MWLTKADDVVVCMDAATGKTLWKTTFPNQGRYYGHRGTGRAKGAYTSNLAVGDGKVVVHGTSGKTYCLDAGTGKHAWSSPQGGGALRIIAADVVVASGDDVVALDMETGQPRWKVEDAGSPTAMPVRWKHDGKEYLICGTKSGKLTCIEAKTGKLLWQQTDSGDNSYSMSLHGDVLVCNGAAYGKRKPMQLAAYRLSLTGAKRLWMIPAETRIYNAYKAPTAVADGHAFVRLSKANRVYAADLTNGKIVQDMATSVGSSGYVFWMDHRLAVQPDASHSRTDFWWFDVSKPSAMKRNESLWRARHRTTSSYYPVLMSHALADGRIFIRGQRGIVCYDLRAK
jgi:outer membrane protein assembly factor BamB